MGSRGVKEGRFLGGSGAPREGNRGRLVEYACKERVDEVRRNGEEDRRTCDIAGKM